MRLKDWYKGLLTVWLPLDLAALAIGYGFSGGNISGALDLSGLDPESVKATLGAWAFMLIPVFLAPFGIIWRRSGAGPEDEQS